MLLSFAMLMLILLLPMLLIWLFYCVDIVVFIVVGFHCWLPSLLSVDIVIVLVTVHVNSSACNDLLL